jgi:hypothetical protein
MVVGRDTLYLYGGMMELGDREVTLDDLYTMDLNKLDAWNLVIEVILKLVFLASSVLRLASQISHAIFDLQGCRISQSFSSKFVDCVTGYKDRLGRSGR